MIDPGSWARAAISGYPECRETNAMPTRHVDLTDRYDSFIESSIASGRFSNASEAILAGLQLLEQQEAEDKAKLEWLRGTAQEAFAALDRGEGIPLSSAEDIDSLVGDAVAEMRAARRASHA